MTLLSTFFFQICSIYVNLFISLALPIWIRTFNYVFRCMCIRSNTIDVKSLVHICILTWRQHKNNKICTDTKHEIEIKGRLKKDIKAERLICIRKRMTSTCTIVHCTCIHNCLRFQAFFFSLQHSFFFIADRFFTLTGL